MKKIIASIVVLLVVSSPAQAGWLFLDSESCIIEPIMGQKIEQAGTDNKVEENGTDNKAEENGTGNKVEEDGTGDKSVNCFFQLLVPTGF